METLALNQTHILSSWSSYFLLYSKTKILELNMEGEDSILNLSLRKNKEDNDIPFSDI